MLIISTKIEEIMEKIMISLALKRHCLLGTLRFLLSPVIPVRTAKIPDSALSIAPATTRNFGALVFAVVVVIIKMHITTKSNPLIAKNILIKIKKADRLLLIK